jgi:uncharacterized SAM-binding protein YcdF (DUF218 family)
MSLASLPTLLIVPPLNCLVAACAGAALWRRRAGRVLLAVGLAGLVLFSLPLVSGTLLASLEQVSPAQPRPGDPPGAIIILSGDETELNQAGKDVFAVGPLTLERERAGAVLARSTGLPVLVSGGRVRDGSPSLAALMQASLHDDFGIDPKWLEDRSIDTWQNAEFSAAMLHAAGIGTVYLVTSAWHMRRALIAFRVTGLHVIASPSNTGWPRRLELLTIIPRSFSWVESYYALHEWIGCAWYALRAREAAVPG